MVKIGMVLVGLLLAGCSPTLMSKDAIEEVADAPEIIMNKRFNELANMRGVDGPIIPIAVYRFPDMTGQRKPATNFASLSSAVTQGAEVFLIKALQDAGRGRWFQVVERDRKSVV